MLLLVIVGGRGGGHCLCLCLQWSGHLSETPFDG